MKAKRVLYLSYNGILEPIFQSQGLPYLRRLANAEMAIVLLTFEKKEDLHQMGSQEAADYQRKLSEEGILWHRFHYHKRPPLLSTVFDVLVGMIGAWYIAKKYSVDLVHARGSIPASFGWAVSRFIKKPFLFDMRGFLAEEYADGGIWRRNGWIFRLVSRMERLFLKSADGVVVLNHPTLAYLRKQKICPDHVPLTVIPCCVDLKRFETVAGQGTAETKDNFVLVYIGSLGTWYLLDHMLDFYQVLKEKIPNASFQILTQTRDRTLQKKLRRYSDNGLTIRETRYEEVAGALACASAGISFIKPLFSKMASSPVKVGEYLASGLPVILNPNVGDTEALIRENRVGVLVTDFKRPCYQKAIEELITLLREGEGLSERCRCVASSQLSIEEGTRRYHEIYKALLKKNS